ncbi:MAG: NTP transferase domain-containing protein [Deltaproteobacteria bacterium]|jgi:mannose-1-phosphate guanylyltransferase|nr:NTP transferase domain-containing protein [Deltaproteobacteria bacterium]MBW2537644.1 NTP transferase domain-containing protein [Deltaproteobacteria bacterium]
MVLAAGLGTRLRPLTELVPKPLVPVGDRSVLGHVAAELERGGASRLVANTHHRAERFDETALRELALPCQLVHEPEILGTAGGVANARDALGEGDVILWNGDILADLDVAALLAAHRRRQPLATLAVCARPRASGTLGLGDQDHIVRLRGERYGEEQRAVDFVGIQVISAALRERLPPAGCLVGDAYQPALRRGEPIAVAEVVRSWSDIGNLCAYHDANLAWLEQRGLDRWVASDARVGPDVVLTQCVVGPRAQVVGAGELRGVVVWPDAVVEAPLTNAVAPFAGPPVRIGEPGL